MAGESWPQALLGLGLRPLGAPAPSPTAPIRGDLSSETVSAQPLAWPSFGSVPASSRCRLLRWRHTTSRVVSRASTR